VLSPCPARASPSPGVVEGASVRPAPSRRPRVTAV
jgi:hypothetical protein